MRHFLIYLFLIYCSLTAQAVFFHGAKPDIVLVFICIYTLKYGQMKGVVLGGFAGLLIDTVNGFIMGPNMLSKAVIAFLTHTIKDNFFQWNSFINALVVTVLSVVDIFIVFISLEIFSKASFVNRSWDSSLLQVVYTLIVSVILYPLMTGREKIKI
jgi:rod shape-determining protein MreD